MCACQFCKNYRKMNRVIGKLSKRDGRWLTGLLGSLWEKEADLEWRTAVWKGEWPDAINSMQTQLKKLQAEQSAKV